MRLPAFRLTFSAPSFDWLERFAGRRFLLYAVYTAVLFAIFLVVNFPHELIVRRAVRALDLGALHLDVAGARFAWWNGYELQGVRLTQRDPEMPPLLETSTLYIRPGLKDLLRGQVSSLELEGPLYGGKIEGRWVSGEGMMRASVRFQGVQLGRYHPLTSLLEEGQIGGVLSGTVTLE